MNVKSVSLSLGFLSIFISGCGKPAPVVLPGQPLVSPVLEGERGGKPPELVSDIMAYRADQTAPSATSARIFLVAGGMHNANFAQEVVDQRKLWKSAGYADSDIACYYAIPLESEFKADEVQYRALASELKHCYPASPKLLWRHLDASSKNPRVDFVHVYVTSHGGEPLSEQLKNPAIGFPQKLKMGQVARLMPQLDQYLITLDVLPDGKTGTILARMRDMAENKTAPEDHLFSPRYLRDALAKFTEETPKFVTLQACHSGGFIDTEVVSLQPDTLKTVKNITALSAARADRASFGCNAGVERTMFGELYGRALALNLDDPRSVDWKQVYDQASEDVSRMEKKYSLTPSVPQFFTNQGDAGSEESEPESGSATTALAVEPLPQ